jgi:hypothetical protein
MRGEIKGDVRLPHLGRNLDARLLQIGEDFISLDEEQGLLPPRSAESKFYSTAISISYTPGSMANDSVNWDVEELEAKREEIEKKNLLKIILTV